MATGSAVGGGIPRPVPPTERLNAVAREHEVSTSWTHQERARALHTWFDRFNDAFFQGQLPTALLQFERARWTTLGDYLPGRNGIGALHQIRLNVRNLDGPLYDALAILLHTMIHQWEQVAGRPGKRFYHSREFARKSAELGIPCRVGYGGQILQYRDPFVSLLCRHGVWFDPQKVVPVHPAPDEEASKLKKWSCRRTNIRAAVAVEAQCLRCGQPFQRSRAGREFKLHTSPSSGG
jgi:hypothetical protein